MTVLTDIDHSRVLDVERGRTIESGNRVLDKTFDQQAFKNIKTVVSDPSDAYLNVGRNKVPGATQVADRFHIMKMLGEAVDKTRKQELKREKELLTHSKFVLLKSAGEFNRCPEDQVPGH